ncbi:MAG TPA: hypothetical protein VGK19_20845 [Capsulimonadaceae bacterium]|jgi:hypothetical protein
MPINNASYVQWNGPRPTPDDIGIDTPLSYLNESWRIAVALVDKGRDIYWQRNHTGDGPGHTGAWLPVSLGKRGHMSTLWDERDIRHQARLMAYLWSGEEYLANEFFGNLFVDLISAEGELLGHSKRQPRFPATANISTMYSMVCGDMLQYFEPSVEIADTVITQAAAFAARLIREFDPEQSGLLNVGHWANTFWGTHLGEPNHYPVNYDPTTKAVVPTMAFTVFLRKAYEAATLQGSDVAAPLAEALKRGIGAIETGAWSELDQYYYVQRDENSGRWFHTLNGIRETSRETDVVPHYAAELCPDMTRVRQVGRVIHDALVRERCFPMPQYFPTFSWYSPEHPNGVDQGDDCGQIGGAWDTPYFHCVQALERAGLQNALQRAILRRAEVAVRDGDFLESYRLDGTVDHATFFNRDEYVVSATAHLTAIIEGLFGVTPAKIGFREVNIRPNLPLYRAHRHTMHPSPWAERDNRLRVRLGEAGHLDLVVRYDESSEMVHAKTNPVGIPAHFRIPLDLASRFKRATWNGEPLAARIEQGMDTAFVYASHVLDGGELLIHLDPHPGKGRGTTPSVPMREACS